MAMIMGWLKITIAPIELLFSVRRRQQRCIQPSLNDCLYAGSCLLGQLYYILVQVRLHSIILMSCIKQVFLNVVICDEDCDHLRFPSCDDPFWQYEMLFSIVSALSLILLAHPFSWIQPLNISLFFILFKWYKKLVDKFLNYLYVYDLTSGFFNVKETYNFYLNSKQIVKEVGLELCKWASNSIELVDKINQDENVNSSDPTNELNHRRKVLGIK